MTWHSSNSKVARVNSKGFITALGTGTTTITVKTKNGKTATCKVTVRADKDTLQVLFVGNSKTYVNNIPSKFKSLAKSKGYNVTVTSATIGGTKLYDVANKKKSILTDKAYDYVIMQEQSAAYQNYSTFLKGAKQVKKYATQKNPNAKLFVRQVWLYKNTKNTTTIYKNAANVANAISASLIYDGKAFYSTPSSINLFTDDRHQSNAGAYLSACCIYSSVFKKTPVGLSYKAGLSSATALKLQKIAAKASGF